MKREQLVVEARAKIIWGEPASSVRHFLMTNGFTAAEAGAEVSKHMKERLGSIRRNGLASLIVGVPLIVIGVALCQHALHYKMTAAGARSARGLGAEVAIGLAAGGYGLWKAVNGVVAIVRPSDEDRSLTDM